jgi:hypothetical protein
MREGYRTPTNFELLEKADLVVVGRLQSGAPTGRDASGVGTMTLSPLRVLKGRLTRQPLNLMGMGDGNGMLIPSLPTSLDQSHFSAGLGACVRIFYPPDGLVLAMFERSPEGWRQSWAAFARTAEDVEAEDGIWVRAAEAYVALQAAASPAQRRAAVERRVAELNRTPADQLSQAMAADLQRYLDATSGADRRSDRPGWTLLSMPDETLAVVRASSPIQEGALGCSAGGNVLTLSVPRAERVAELAFVIGDRRFEGEGERLVDQDGVKVLIAEVPISEELLQDLANPAAGAGIATGEAAAMAPPAEVLPLFAHQCRQLRSRQRLPGPVSPARVRD